MGLICSKCRGWVGNSTICECGMNTDIDRLQEIYDKKVSYRGCGKTFAQCHKVACAASKGHKNIICIVTCISDLRYILPLLVEALEDHDFKYVYRSARKEMIVAKSRIIFLAENDYLANQKLRGISDKFFIYMRHSD